MEIAQRHKPYHQIREEDEEETEFFQIHKRHCRRNEAVEHVPHRRSHHRRRNGITDNRAEYYPRHRHYCRKHGDIEYIHRRKPHLTSTEDCFRSKRKHNYDRHHRHTLERIGKRNNCDSLGDLPLDTLCNILSRLPMESLASLRTISKSWSSLMQDPYITDMHSNSNNVPCFISLRSGTTSYNVVEKLNQEWEITTVLDFGLEIVATCNGFLCLSKNSLDNVPLIIYNPVTKETITVPKLAIEDGSHVRVKVSLIFDKKSNKYKLMSMYITKTDVHFMIGYVITLGETLWRKLDLPCEIQRSSYFSVAVTEPAILNGKMYWIIHIYNGRHNPNRIVTVLVMEICDEKFRVIELDDLAENDSNEYFVDVNAEKVTMIVTNRTDQEKPIQIWYLADSEQGIWQQGPKVGNDILNLSLGSGLHDRIRVAGSVVVGGNYYVLIVVNIKVVLPEGKSYSISELYTCDPKTGMVCQELYFPLIPGEGEVFSLVPTLAPFRL